MPRIVSPRPLAVVSLVCAFVFATTASGQSATPSAIHPTVQKQADGLRVKINAKTFPQSIKDVLLADVAKGVDPKLSTDSQFRVLDRVDSDINNTQYAMDSFDAFIKLVDKSTTGGRTLQQRYTALANSNLKYLPRDYNGVMSTMSRLKGEFENFLPVIARLQAFAADVRNSSKAPQALKEVTASSIAQVFSDVATGSSSSLAAALDATQTNFENSIYVIDAIDEFEVKVKRDIPSNFPRFRANTVAAAENIRAGVGKGMGQSHVDALGREYRTRLAVVNNAAEILRWVKEKPQGAFVDPPIISRLDTLMRGIEDYHSTTYDSDAVMVMLIQMRNRGAN